MINIHRPFAFALVMTLAPALALASGKKAEEEEGGEEGGKPKATYVSMEPAFVTNFTDDKIRYIRTDVSIKVMGEKTKEAVRAHVYAIRHHLVMLLNRQTEQDLRSVEGRTQLAQDATAEVIAVLQAEDNPTDVEEVLFTSFVIN